MDGAVEGQARVEEPGAELGGRTNERTQPVALFKFKVRQAKRVDFGREPTAETDGGGAELS